MPGTAFLCDFALHRARKISLMPVRVLATTGAVFIMAPAYAAPALVMPADERLVNAMNSSDSCVTRSQVEKLNSLPTSNLAIPLDITPAILASTPHRAIASGYHRNNGGIHDVILLFAGKLATSREILARRHIDYVVFCPKRAGIDPLGNPRAGGTCGYAELGPGAPSGSSRFAFRAFVD